jgi:RNA polymerase sigma-70 factor (ECF subfamily)
LPDDSTKTRRDPDDSIVISRIRAGDVAAFELLMRRHNRLVYRAVRAVLKDDREVEDVMQDAYVAAFSNLAEFEGRSRFSTWLTRIAVHQAFSRLRREQRFAPLPDTETEDNHVVSASPTPEQNAIGRELGQILEQAVDSLPESFRAVFVLRAVEQLSVEETATCLDIPEETVKTRLHRARGFLRKSLEDRVGAAVPTLFDFHLSRCDRVVQGVLVRIQTPR